MQSMTRTGTKIEFTETMSTGMRSFLFAIGLFPWIAPYEFFVKYQWREFSWATLFFLFISLGAVSVSVGFIGAALFGLNQTITLDLSARTITHRYENVIQTLRTRHYPFRDIVKAEVREHNWESGPDTYSVEIRFTDRHKILTGDFSSRTEAEDVLKIMRI